ncbi:MAG: alkaline shock response membrane anchor protein AmaP [Bacillota bacterium]
MKTLLRLVLVLIGLMFIGGAFFLLAVNYNLVPGLAFSLPAWTGQDIVLAVTAGIILIGLILIILGLRSPKKVANAVMKGSQYGEIAISITAIENMVLRVVQQIQGIKDVSRQVSFTQDGLVIKVKVRVMPDVPMPGVADELQSKIKEYVEEMTGITVHEVKVNVDNIVVDQAPSTK